jgi:uncharacterized damage-inducible protein DinB
MERGDLRLLAAYTAWADRRTLDSVRELRAEEWERPLATSHGSLAGTLEHVFAAEWTWLQRLEGRSPATLGPEGGARDRDCLAQLWPAVWDGWRQAAERRPPGEVIRYVTTQGAPHQATLAEVLLHLSHHSAAHRGQVVTLLRSLGRQPASTDLIVFLRTRA